MRLNAFAVSAFPAGDVIDFAAVVPVPPLASKVTVTALMLTVRESWLAAEKLAVPAAFARMVQAPTPSRLTVPDEMLQTVLLAGAMVKVTVLPEPLVPLTVKVPLVIVRSAG